VPQLSGSVWGRLWALAVIAWSAPLSTALAQQPWYRADSRHFEVYGHLSEVTVQRYALMLEEFDGLLRAYHQRPYDEPVPRKLKVFLVGSRDEFQKLAKLPPDIVGVYRPGISEILIVGVVEPAINPYAAFRRDEIIFHEYTHHFMMQYYGGAYPAWLSEGYADYFSQAELRSAIAYMDLSKIPPTSGQHAMFKGEIENPDRTSIALGSVHLERHLAVMTTQRPKWLPIKTLMTKIPQELNPEQRKMFYAQSWLLTDYLLSDKDRRRSLADYLERLRHGEASEPAWRAAFGHDLKWTEDEMYRFNIVADREGLRTLWARTWPEPKATVTRLSPLASAELPFEVGLALGAKPTRPEEFIASLKRFSDASPGERRARLNYLKAEMDYGDAALARTGLEELAAKNPSDPELLLQVARSRMKAAPADPQGRLAAFRSAGAALGEAAKLAPDNYQVLLAFAQSREVEADYPSENTLNVLLKAVYLAPQVNEIRIVAAKAALARRQFDLTRSLLKPVLSDPHAGPELATAKSLIAGLP
jgi:hypothetical protein